MNQITRSSLLLWTTSVLCLIAIASLTPFAYAQEGEEETKGWDFIEAQHAINAEFETPHTQWAKPLAGGPIRVVFLSPWFQGSTEPREIVELIQRFDIDGHAVYLMGNRLVGDGRPDWYGGDPEAGTNRFLRFAQAGQNAFFINKINLDTLPAAVWDAIRQNVSDGTGLVMIANEAAPINEAQLIAEPPHGLPATGKYYALGKGRVAVLPERLKLDYSPGWETAIDYQFLEQGRALIWAAGRSSEALIHIDAPDTSASAQSSASVQWNQMPQVGAIHVTLRRWDGLRLDLANIAATDSGSEALSLPRLREGKYHLDAIASINCGSFQWATASFNVTTSRRIDAIELDRNWAEIGETISGHVRLSGNLEPDDTLDLRLADIHGRILKRQSLPTAAEGVPFSWTVDPWDPMLMLAEAVLMHGEDEIAHAYQYVRATTRNRGQFNFIMWNAASGDLDPYGYQSLARYGVTAILQGGAPPFAMAAANLAYVPYAASFRASSHTLTAMLDPDTGLLKSGCVHDPEAMAKAVKQVVDGARAAREHGVFAYSLGDENAVRASCLGPHCIAAYRRYLQNVYGSIDALNRSWDTAYASFDDIQLLTEGDLPASDAPAWFTQYFQERQTLHRTDSEGAKDEALERQVDLGNTNDEMRALQAGNFPRWYDRQAFQNQSYIDWCKQFQQAFLQMDPHAWTGFEGTDSFTIRNHTTRSRQGGDLDGFVREMDYYGSYEGPGNEVLRSIAPPGFPMGSWIGYTPDVEELIFKYWQQVADRMNAIQWWRWDNLDGYNGYLAPNLAPFPATREILDDTQVVRDGLGTLLMQCQMHDDGIAMFYSMPSTYIAHFDGNPTYGSYKRDHDRWHALLHDAGLQFSYITDRMLRQGETDLSKFKVLILPLAFALSTEEAEAIRQFVDQGGVLLADLRPGLYDSHCKPLAHGQLNDVFGIDQTGNLEAREIDRMSVNGNIQDQQLTMRWGNWHGKDIYPQMKVDPNVVLTTAKSLGEAYFIHFWTGLKAPQCIVNEFGQGRAILLNFSIYDAPAAGLLRNLLAASGVEPALHVTKPNGNSIKDIEISRFADGNIELVFLLGKHEGDVRVNLPEARHVYDLKTRQYLGLASEFTTSLRPNRASCFAMACDQPMPPALSIPEKAARGSVSELNVSIPGAAGKHAVLIRVTAPDGTLMEWQNKTIITDTASVSIPLPIAFNDPTGEWKIQATDLFTQNQTVGTFTVD